jgi:putative membrane protein
MPSFLIRWGMLGVSLWIAVQLVSGLEITGGFGQYALIAAIFGLVNAVLGTVVKILTFPLMILTLGLFSLVVNAGMLALTAALVDSFQVDNFGSALLGGIVISVAGMVSKALLRSV